MALTLAEFLHPLKDASQRNLVLAVMYYLSRYEHKNAVTTTEIRAGFERAKHTKGKRIQYAAVLNQAAPYVHTPEGKETGQQLRWALTDTGDSHVRSLLNLPDADAEIEHDVSTLTAVAEGLQEEIVRSYVLEAIVCLRSGALRATVVFLWTGAVASLRDKVWAHGPAAIAPALVKYRPKAPSFKKKDDFAYINDATLLLIAQDLGVIDKTEKQRLEEALNLRNGCGHPSKYTVGPRKVSSFVEDVVGIVW